MDIFQGRKNRIQCYGAIRENYIGRRWERRGKEGIWGGTTNSKDLQQVVLLILDGHKGRVAEEGVFSLFPKKFWLLCLSGFGPNPSIGVRLISSLPRHNSPAGIRTPPCHSRLASLSFSRGVLKKGVASGLRDLDLILVSAVYSLSRPGLPFPRL